MIGDSDRAAVDHSAQAFQGILRKEKATGHEVFIANLQGGRQETSHIDLGAGTEQNAVGVHEEYPAIRLQLAEYDGRINADHPVQGNRMDRRLGETDCFACPDGKLLPVDNGLVRRLLDLERLRGWLADGGLPSRHLAAVR